MKKREVTNSRYKRPPLWIWLVIIILMIAMPLMFSFYRDAQTQQALENSGQ